MSEMSIVCQFASKVEDRERIQAFHYSNTGHVVGTDGFRVYATKEPYDIKRANKTYKVKDFEESGDYVENDEFVEWKKVVPNTFSRKVQITIPSWFANFTDPEQREIFTLDYSDRDLPRLIVGNCSNERSVVFNANLLAPLAGREVSFLVTTSLAPAIITSKDIKVEEYCENLRDELYKEDWFALLMPMRLDLKTSTDDKVHV